MLVSFDDKVIDISKEAWDKFINDKPNKEFIEQCEKARELLRMPKIKSKHP